MNIIPIQLYEDRNNKFIDITEEELFYLRLKYNYKTVEEIFNDLV